MLNPYKSLILPKVSRYRIRNRNWYPLKKLFKIGKYKLYLYAYKPHNYKKRLFKTLERYVKVVKESGRYHTWFKCYSLNDGSYIGVPENVLKYCNLGVQHFYKPSTNSCVASIGFDPKRQIWWGWSHRAICSFEVGDKIKYDEDLLILQNGWTKKAPLYESEEKKIQQIKKMFKDGVLEIKTTAEAKFLAKRFANSVS